MMEIKNAICNAPWLAWRHLYRARVVDGIIGSRCTYCGAPGRLPMVVYLFCSECGRVLTSSISKMQGLCGPCHYSRSDYSVEWRRQEEIRLHIRDYQKEYAAVNKDHIRDYQKEYHVAYDRQYYLEHKEKIKARSHKRYHTVVKKSPNLPIEV